MITDYMRKTILTYQDALDYIRNAYQARGLKRNNFTPALKDMYDLMREIESVKDKQNAKKLERKKKWS